MLAGLAFSFSLFIHLVACSDVENRDLFDTTKKEGTVEQESSSSAMFGFAGTGKSHVLALIFGELPPSKRVSTAVAKTPVRAVGFVRMAVTLKDLEKMGSLNSTESKKKNSRPCS